MKYDCKAFEVTVHGMGQVPHFAIAAHLCGEEQSYLHDYTSSEDVAEIVCAILKISNFIPAGRRGSQGCRLQ